MSWTTSWINYAGSRRSSLASMGCVYSMRMARVNVYLPDELAEQARAADLNVSGLTQEAIRRALDARAVNDWLDDLASLDPIDVDYALVKQAVTEAKDEFGL